MRRLWEEQRWGGRSNQNTDFRHGRFDMPVRPPSGNVKEATGYTSLDAMERLEIGREMWELSACGWCSKTCIY